MKLRNISIISAGIIMLLLPVKASAFIIPKDLPTIEALIALHKAIKKDEDKALTRVATSYGEQSLIEKGAEKFNDVRTTLDTRLNNAYSYLVLAGAISSTANSLYQLVTEYKDFTGNTFSYVSKKPFVAVGDAIVVKVTDIDQQGRINLSRRDAILALEAKRAEQQAQQQ